MEPLFRQLVVGLVPQPTSVPPTPFDRDALQRVFADVSRDYPYQQLAFTPDGAGAHVMNSPEDAVIIQPGLIQIRIPVMSAEAAREQAVRVQSVIAERLRLSVFLVAGIKVVAHVSAPGQDAKVFLGERLMHGGEQAEVLGTDFFAGGIKYRRIMEPHNTENVLLIEPYVHDNGFLFIDYDTQHGQPFESVGDLSGWVDEAFDFVRGPTMALLEGVTDG